MIKDVSFGSILREVRLRNKVTLRKHCKNMNICPGNLSKVERNHLAPPKSTSDVMRYLTGLDYTELELEFLVTAAMNHHIANVIARF